MSGMKLEQDFLGTANRLRSKLSEFEERTAELMSKWRDGTATEFHDQHLLPIIATLRRLTISLHEAADTANQCDRVLREEDLY
jgi:uncharacterized protein YukE